MPCTLRSCEPGPSASATSRSRSNTSPTERSVPLVRRQLLRRRAQIAGLPRHGLDFRGLTVERLRQRLDHEPTGHAEFEIDELGNQSTLNQVGHLRRFVRPNRAVDLRQDVDHRVAGGDLVQALEDDGKLAEGHVSGSSSPIGVWPCHPGLNVGQTRERVVGNVICLAVDRQAVLGKHHVSLPNGTSVRVSVADVDGAMPLRLLPAAPAGPCTCRSARNRPARAESRARWRRGARRGDSSPRADRPDRLPQACG